ncbi:MAG: hypothetical protein LBL67_03335 [Coriobacteriales bacterium]|nr:hypothetical protein [Coriobacteriales bacterium]
MSCVYSYRDASGKARSKTFVSFGYLDQLAERYRDPLAHCQAMVERFNQGEHNGHQLVEDLRESGLAAPKPVVAKNLGYFFPYHLYEELGIESFWRSVQQKQHVLYDLNAVFRLLTMLRCLRPTGPFDYAGRRGCLFERADFRPAELFDATVRIAGQGRHLLNQLRLRLPRIYQPELKLGFYHKVHTYLGLNFGHLPQAEQASKGHPEQAPATRALPGLVRSALLTDARGIPLDLMAIDYLVDDPLRHRADLLKSRQAAGLGRIVSVEDIGIKRLGDLHIFADPAIGFILSQDISGAQGELREWILNDAWSDSVAGERFKSRKLRRRFCQVDAQGDVHQAICAVKQVCVYSPDHAALLRRRYQRDLRRQLHERNRLAWLGQNPPSQGQRPGLARIEQLGGYQVLLTTETKMPAREVAVTFRRHQRAALLFENLPVLPRSVPTGFDPGVYVRTHFLVSFVVILLLSLLQKDLKDAYTAQRICQALDALNCINLRENLYCLTDWSEIAAELSRIHGVNFSSIPMTLAEIHHQLAKLRC